VAGQRIGETFASIWTVIVDLFKGLYNIVIAPIHQIVDAIYQVINAIASTSIGRRGDEEDGH
jgi:hypothetical protein